MDIELLRYFIKVAETLNFREAAGELYTSKATLSRKISGLEQEIGIKLFERTTRSVRLNEAGALLLENAGRVVADFDDMILKMQGFEGKSAGVIRIGYFRDETAEYMARIVERMRKDYSAVKMEYRKAGLNELLKDLDDGSLDAALIFRACVDESIHYERLPIAREYPSLIVFQDHPLAKESSAVFEDLAGERVVISDWKDIPLSVNQDMEEYFRRQGIQTEPLDPDFDWGRQMMRIRLGECVMIDPLATDSLGLPDPFRRIPLISEDERFDRDLVFRRDNENPILFALKRTVETMVREEAFC